MERGFGGIVLLCFYGICRFPWDSVSGRTRFGCIKKRNLDKTDFHKVFLLSHTSLEVSSLVQG